MDRSESERENAPTAQSEQSDGVPTRQDENQGENSRETQLVKGVGPWQGPLPTDPRYDPTLLAEGDHRNVEDRYRYWKREAVRADIAARSLGYEIAIENLGHDFNIGSIVRTSNALGVSAVHIVGRRRWNRRGAMVTDRYLNVDHMYEVAELVEYAQTHDKVLIGIDIFEGSKPIEAAVLPRNAILVFGEESNGLSPEMSAACQAIYHITQYGSTRSMNVGHAAAIAMWAWVIQHGH